MRYHNITYDDMLNGDGLRVVLWVSGCEHRCAQCQNPITWDVSGGIEFAQADKDELFGHLAKDHTAGITFSGGDPLHPANVPTVTELAKEVKTLMPCKTVWLYTGYTWDEVKDLPIMQYVDVLVDGEFVYRLKDNNVPWCGSTNQKVIDVQRSLRSSKIILWGGPDGQRSRDAR